MRKESLEAVIKGVGRVATDDSLQTPGLAVGLGGGRGGGGRMGMGEAASGDPGRMGGQSKEPCTRGTGGGSAFGRGMGGYPRPGPGGKLPPLNPEEGKTGVDLEGIKVGPHRS